MINRKELALLQAALDTLEKGSAGLPDFVPDFDVATAAEVIARTAERMQDNYPYYHPQYAGQMLKPPHPVARIAYALSLWVNPNNHALDGGRASSAMEKECIVELGHMYGWEQPLGHLTGGGTMANLEALWVARQLHPGKRVLASELAHYTHSRLAEVLGIPFAAVPVNTSGHMEIAAIEKALRTGEVGTVVVTMGTTGFGTVDPLPELLALREQYEFRIHADAAYGGYFGLCGELADGPRDAFARLPEVDSIVIDPHKHGLQPYGCGCILFKDTSVGAFYKHGSPYTYFSSSELHLGEISLECSRPGASAAALWATMQLMPLTPGGEFAEGLDASLRAARHFWQTLHDSDNFLPLMRPEIDIVVYAVQAETSELASTRAREIFEKAAQRDLHLALIEVPAELFRHYVSDMTVNTASVSCLRSVLMKPEHEGWVDRITELLEASAR